MKRFINFRPLIGFYSSQLLMNGQLLRNRVKQILNVRCVAASHDLIVTGPTEADLK